MKQKVIVVLGQTATGKSALAIKIALRLNSGQAKKINPPTGGEIISADSRQVYRWLDIGTGKVPGKWVKNDPTKKRPFVSWIFAYKSIPHYCIDFVSPQKIYTAAEFKKCAKSAIADITARGKIPIIVGGTGFWIDTLIFNLLLPNVAPNPKLRLKLSSKKPDELFKILKKLDLKRAKTIDSKNSRRLIRAIEIALALGKIPTVKKRPRYNALWLGVSLPKDELRERIRLRLQKRIKSGMIKEAMALRKSGVSWKRFYELGLEYRFLADFLKAKIDKNEFIELLNRAIRQYAKRQMTWFKKNKKIHWIKSENEARRLIRMHLKKSF